MRAEHRRNRQNAMLSLHNGVVYRYICCLCKFYCRSFMVNVRRMQLRVKDLDITASSCCTIFEVDHALLNQVFILQCVNTPFLGFALRGRQYTPENGRIEKEGVDETV